VTLKRAVNAADVVGYSRLMGRDESGTLARLREPLFRDSQIGISRYAPQAINPTPTT
jgi:class 3 adenylate cyclase